MATGDFIEWGPKRLDDHSTRIVELEANHKLMSYRLEQSEMNHRETLKVINEFVGETRASFANAQDDLHKRLGSLHDKVNGISQAVSQGQGAAGVLRVVLPMAYAAVGGVIMFFAMRPSL